MGYFEHGDPMGPPVVLLHGFPYDVQAYAAVAPMLATHGARVFTPYLRGFGPTAFTKQSVMRSGQQAALGNDLLAFMDVIGLEKAYVGGYDWGGRAACIVAALFPERILGLVTVGGYNILDIAISAEPAPPESEYRYWYQYYFHGERGRKGLTRNRRDLCRLLWRLWSPQWQFTESDFHLTAPSFDNPDFVEVVIHSYRHRYGLVPGDPMLERIETELAKNPAITVPTICMYGDADGVDIAFSDALQHKRFSGRHRTEVVAGAGHNIPQEFPRDFANAVLTLIEWNSLSTDGPVSST